MSEQLPQPHQLSHTRTAPIYNGLTARQAAFVEHWLKTQNATASVMAAYGYTDAVHAAVRGSKLLRLDKVAKEIRRRLNRHIASADEVLERLTEHARGDLADVLQPDGSFDLRKAKKSGKSRLLKKLKVKKRYEKDEDGNLHPIVEHEFEIHDPQAALEKMGRFHKLFTDKVEVEQPQLNSITQQLSEVREALLTIARTEHLSEYDAAIRLAAQLEDVPELASQLRTWAEEELKAKELPK